jgi:transcriptional regulator of heat shock response
MLDERKSAILRAIVEEYIKTAQPVGSAHLTRAPELSVSAATIRNEMSVLEREGYLHQPHTSAGRVPTDKGYRFFVDQLVPPDHLDPRHQQQVREFFDQAHGALEQMLRDTSQLLSRLTDYSAVVVGPQHDHEPEVFVGGVSRVAAAFDTVETVRQVLTTLEQQFVVVTLLREVLSRGVNVAIGQEHGLAPLAECSVVVAPYEVEGEPLGTIGILGPTRMDYERAMATVAVVSQRLGRRLSEG